MPKRDNILLVEDSRTQAVAMSADLERRGFSVKTAASGPEGLERLLEGGFDAVVADILMPGLTGYGLCRKIKRHRELKRVPVILLTTLADPMDIMQGLESGAESFVIKPVDPDLLAARLRGLLDRARGTGACDGVLRTRFMGKELRIYAKKAKIIDYLAATFEDFVRAKDQEYAVRRERDEAEGVRVRMQEAIDAIGRAICVVDESGEVSMLNRVWRDLAAEDCFVGSSFAVGESWREKIRICAEPCREAAGELVARFDEAVKNGSWGVGSTYSTGEVVRPRWFKLEIRFFKGASGERSVWVNEEVTEAKLLEQKLMRAQRLDAVGRLAGGVAHDFNNLLTSISGFSDLILGDLGESHPSAPDLREIRKTVDRAAGLTRQLLAFSKKQVLHPRVIQVDAVFNDMEKMLRRMIGEDIAFHAEFAPGSVLMDPSRLEQVLLNLVVNARDAMPEGGRLSVKCVPRRVETPIELETGNEVAPGDYMELSVGDTGCGMTPEVRDKIFEPFFTTKGQNSGTGLGLSTLYGIVRQSGGAVSIYSEPGKGSTFKIFLPRVEEVEEDAPKTPPTSVGRAKAGGVIAVVDDNEQIRTVLTRVLRGAGFAPLVFETPQRALDELPPRLATLDLLMTDVVMPGLNGPELAERLRSSRADLPVLYLSGYADTESVPGARIPADAAFLSKPFSSAQILDAVTSALGGDG